MLASTLRDLLYGLYLVLWNLGKVLALLAAVVYVLYYLIARDTNG